MTLSSLVESSHVMVDHDAEMRMIRHYEISRLENERSRPAVTTGRRCDCNDAVTQGTLRNDDLRSRGHGVERLKAKEITWPSVLRIDGFEHFRRDGRANVKRRLRLWTR